MPYIAVKLNCFQPWKTEVRDYPYYGLVQKLGPEWLVYEMESRRNLNGSLIKMAYDDETNMHLSRPG